MNQRRWKRGRSEKGAILLPSNLGVELFPGTVYNSGSPAVIAAVLVLLRNNIGISIIPVNCVNERGIETSCLPLLAGFFFFSPLSMSLIVLTLTLLHDGPCRSRRSTGRARCAANLRGAIQLNWRSSLTTFVLAMEKDFLQLF